MYNKLFTKILDSSIWLESSPTRIVWLTMIAVMDEDGFAQFASVANVSHRARVSVEEAQEALRCLESPDVESSDPDHEGRRLERVPGGWLVLNAQKHRDMVTRLVSREHNRLRVQRFRATKRNALGVTKALQTITCNASVSEAVSVSEAEKKGGKALTPPSALQTLWNDTRDPGPKVSELTKERRRRYTKALETHPDLDEWATVIRWLNTQPWANAPGSGEHANWRATLDWLAKPGKLAEKLELARADAQAQTQAQTRALETDHAARSVVEQERAVDARTESLQAAAAIAWAALAPDAQQAIAAEQRRRLTVEYGARMAPTDLERAVKRACLAEMRERLSQARRSA